MLDIVAPYDAVLCQNLVSKMMKEGIKDGTVINGDKYTPCSHCSNKPINVAFALSVAK